MWTQQRKNEHTHEKQNNTKCGDIDKADSNKKKQYNLNFKLDLLWAV